MIFKIYDCDFGFKKNGVTYNFEHVRELQIEDPERNNLTRGSNSGNKEGLAFREGISEPKRWTLPILKMSAPMKAVLQDSFENPDGPRLDCFAVDKKTGSSKWLKQALLANAPMQATLDETADSMNVSLEFISFDNTENHKE